MANGIPGLPQIGQGVPGGAAGLPGYGSALGGPSTQIPGLGSGIHIQSSTIKTPNLSGSLLSPAPKQPSQLPDPQHELRLQHARTILQQVQLGRLEPKAAQNQLDRLLNPQDRLQLTREALTNSAKGIGPSDVRPQLQALKYQTMGKSPGATASLDPNRGTGVGSNIVTDLEGMITGLPAGIGLTAVNTARDLNAVSEGKKPTHVYENIVKPIAENYKTTYGSALHGDFGPMKEHPLGPVLDAASLLSAGIGGATRVGAASEAIDAARASNLATHGAESALSQRVIQRLGDRGYTLEHFTPGQRVPNELQTGMNEWQNDSGLDEASAAMHGFHQEPGELAPEDTHFVVLKDRNGKPQAAGSFRLGKDKISDIDIGANEPGAGASLIHELTRQFPGRKLTFVATPENIPYYTRAGATPTGSALISPGGHVMGQPFELNPLTTSDGLSRTQLAKAGISAALKTGGKGSLIDKYESYRGINHEAEIQNTMKEVSDVLENSNLRMNPRTVGQVAKDVWADIKETRATGRARPTQMAADLPGHISATSTGRALATGETALREASDLVRAGAIYLRPAYLPNNWAGNLFMNAVHQGVLAPVNLAKSLVVDKHIGKRYTAAMDKAMGQNAAEAVTNPTARGYVSSATQPIAHVMGALADQPFRRAAFLHEARRAGYSKLTDVKSLFDRASGHEGMEAQQTALHEVGDISRRAQEEIVKFGHMNDTEKSVVRNLLFVYSWIRGASRYTARFPFQHPIQTSVFNHLGNDVGQPYLDKTMGGVPTFLMGSVPVGRDKNGNPLLINPFALNPLGTGMQVAQAAIGTAQVAKPMAESLIHGKVPAAQFNKFAQQDVVGLTNPLIQAYLGAREGQAPNLQSNIAVANLAHQLKHPGSGSIYPMSRTEALGHFTVGALFPRVGDQQAITSALERENRNDPQAMIPQQRQQIEKALGEKLPDSFVEAYQHDLTQYQGMKSFQQKYALDHGQAGFKNLPAQNQLDAALEFLQKTGHLHAEEVKSLQRQTANLTNDAEIKDLSNTLWGSTGVGQYRTQWNQLMSEVHGLQLTRERK